MTRSHRHLSRLVRVLVLVTFAVAGSTGTPAGAVTSAPDASLALTQAQAFVEATQEIQHYVAARRQAELAAFLQAIAARQQAEVAAFLQAVAVSEFLSSLPHIAVDWARWEALHNCEQPGNWYANGTNPADPNGQVFQGGLGMSTHAWQMAVAAAGSRGLTLPTSALAATPEEQMIGSQAFFDAYGWGWECHV